MGHIIRAIDPRLCMIDFSIPRFLAQKDVVPVELPPQLAIPEVAAPREEIASSRLSLEEEIDQFRLEEEREEQGDPVIHISDPEDEFDRTSVAKIDDSFDEEEEEMAFNLRKFLKDLLMGRNKGSSSKEAPKS